VATDTREGTKQNSGYNRIRKIESVLLFALIKITIRFLRYSARGIRRNRSKFTLLLRPKTARRVLRPIFKLKTFYPKPTNSIASRDCCSSAANVSNQLYSVGFYSAIINRFIYTIFSKLYLLYTLNKRKRYKRKRATGVISWEFCNEAVSRRLKIKSLY